MNVLRFSLTLLRRDWRAGELRLLLVALAVAVAAISTVGFFIDRLGNALSREATQLLGGGAISPGSVIPSGCRPSRIASTMSGASSVSRKTRET